MKASAFYAVIGVGAVLVIGIIWWGTHQAHPQAPATATSTPDTASSSAPSLVGDSIYTNGAYGFAIVYPGADPTQETFDTTYHLPATWRAGAPADATGTSLFQITGFAASSTDSYPRYFEAEVRIGASADPKAIASCLNAGDGESALPDETFNGTDWHVFSFEDAGMMQYAKGKSYRTVHDGSCIALEQVESGSSYHDDPPSASDIPDAVLDQHYEDLSAIIRNFAFARP